MIGRRVDQEYARSVLLGWIRAHAPDFRIVSDGEKRIARFTCRGETVELSAEGVGCDYALVLACVETIRKILGMPSLSRKKSRALAEKAIVEARFAGRDAEADRLGREYVLQNEIGERHFRFGSNAGSKVGD